ncbi:flagellar biosynthesis protein FlhF [Paenibacillus thiaminolyticus]|uniref:flagellar biosynthesis protein FlhF n=1 Tax=Paenibacillus thiaminolyticus TaxID=49283 RepID=UPI001162B864|nr:flagellar biosynthesis protein FlhF [Paenibacillus thiaminolyticus]MDG0871137.1 flagellar biosynthesis protein FlhF [Paenibacillus thiaminolyticus]NGP62583.1 flagellar biosynthesis protein FlhF [Paenibacillus thiaminolyticus]
MRVKKYIVETMPEAMSQIRQELGQDAVIISTKEVRTGGFLGMFSRKAIEVVAAVDEQAQPSRPASSAAKAAAPAEPPARVYVSPTAARSAYGGAPAEPRPPAPQVKEAAPDYTAPRPQRPEEQASPAAGAEERARPLKREETGLASAAPMAFASELEAAVTQASRRPLLDAEWQIEMAEMKQMMHKVMQRVYQESWPEPFKEMERHLLRQGVGSELVNRFIEAAAEQCPHPKDAESAEAKRLVTEQVSEQLLNWQGDGITKATRIVYFVGPTGVGKTTTIAKLAADQIFHHGRKVGFITADTYRISAVEQLRTYASILNVPLEVVTSPGDTERALNALEACDLILMDTAGRNFRNDMFVNELNTMLKPLPFSMTFLVLSLTSKTEDMLAIWERFEYQRIDSLILTKADETATYGTILNLASRVKIPCSYLTTGQNVPDDIQPFQVNDAVRWIMGD